MKLWRLVEDVVLPFVAATLTTTWLALWTLWLIRFFMPGPPPTALAGTLLAAQLAGAFLTRRAGRQQWSARRRQIVGTAAGSAALLVVLAVSYSPRLWLEMLSGRSGLGGPLFLAVSLMLAGALAWWNGLGLGANTVTRDRLEGAFYTGLLALALLLIANNSGRALAAGDLIWPVLLFIGLGLGALALTGLRRLGLQADGARSQWRAVGRDWIIMALGLIGLVLLSGVLLAGMLAPEALDRLGAAAFSLYKVAAAAVAMVLAPLILLAGLLLAPLEGWLRSLGFALAQAVQAVMSAIMALVGVLMRLWLTPPARSPLAQQLQEIVNSDGFRAATRGGTLLIVLAVAALIFWAALRRSGWLTTPEGDEVREGILSRELLLAQLRRLFTRRRPEPPPPPYLTLDGPLDDPRLRVRRAYQDLLAWAASYNLARAAGQTPLAYSSHLMRALPEARDAIAEVTGAYLQARYAAEPPTPEAARRAEQCVDHVLALSPLGSAKAGTTTHYRRSDEQKD